MSRHELVVSPWQLEERRAGLNFGYRPCSHREEFFKSSHSLPPLWSVPVLSIQALYILEYLEDEEEEESEESVESDDLDDGPEYLDVWV